MKKKYLVSGIVGAFLLILIGLIIPNIISNPMSSPNTMVCTDMGGAIKEALKMFILENGAYPTTQEGLEALIKNPDSKKYPNSLYLEKLPLDPWGNPFRYNQYDAKNFEIISFGADGKIGGEGVNRDIVYPDCKKE
jgi:general secretion pathway protein G